MFYILAHIAKAVPALILIYKLSDFTNKFYNNNNNNNNNNNDKNLYYYKRFLFTTDV